MHVAPHFTLNVRSTFNGEFGNQFICRSGPIVWLVLSPELIAIDFNFWKYIKP